MAKTATMKPMPVQQPAAMTTGAASVVAAAKGGKTAPAKKTAMAALFGQKRQKSAVANVPTKTPAF